MKKQFLLTFFLLVVGVCSSFAQSYTVTEEILEDYVSYGIGSSAFINSVNYGVQNVEFPSAYLNMQVSPDRNANGNLIELDLYVEYTDDSYASDNAYDFVYDEIVPISTNVNIDPSKTVKFVEFVYTVYSSDGIYTKRITYTY